jgi:hypothetical protein
MFNEKADTNSWLGVILLLGGQKKQSFTIKEI